MQNLESATIYANMDCDDKLFYPNIEQALEYMSPDEESEVQACSKKQQVLEGFVVLLLSLREATFSGMGFAWCAFLSYFATLKSSFTGVAADDDYRAQESSGYGQVSTAYDAES